MSVVEVDASFVDALGAGSSGGEEASALASGGVFLFLLLPLPG